MPGQSQYEWPSRKKAGVNLNSQGQPASTKQTAKPSTESGKAPYHPDNRQFVWYRGTPTTQKLPDPSADKPSTTFHGASDDDISSHDESAGSMPKIKCTYANCHKRFDTTKEMKRHKTKTPEHEYCKKCDVDCEDWDALVQHKVDAMAPFLNRRDESRTTPKHIVCEFCGQDFGTFGGRKAHREQSHKAQQDIRCTLCEAMFTKVALMVVHLESGKCPHISEFEFMARIQQQRARAQIMKAPGIFNESLALNAKSLLMDTLCLRFRELVIDLKTPDTDAGGVSLIDKDNAEQKKNMGKVLVPDFDLIDLNPPRKTFGSMDPATEYRKAKRQGDDFNPVQLTETSLRERTEQWPFLPSKTKQPTGTSISMSDGTSRQGGENVHSHVDQSSRAKSSPPPTVEDCDESSESTSFSSEYEERPRGRGADKAATQKPHQGDKPSGKEGWEEILKQRDQAFRAHSKGSKGVNMLEWQGWNPNTPEYDPAVFYRFDGVTLSGKYCCPFPDCTLCQYENADDIEQHIRIAHLDTRFRCSSCQKEFKTPSALMGHIEDTINCKIKESNMFKHLIGEVTGDLVKAKHVVQPKVMTPKVNKDLANVGEPCNGVTSVMYETQRKIKW